MWRGKLNIYHLTHFLCLKDMEAFYLLDEVPAAWELRPPNVMSSDVLSVS